MQALYSLLAGTIPPRAPPFGGSQSKITPATLMTVLEVPPIWAREVKQSLPWEN